MSIHFYTGLLITLVGIVCFTFPIIFVKILEDNFSYLEYFLSGEKIEEESIRNLSIAVLIMGLIIAYMGYYPSVIWDTKVFYGNTYSVPHCPNCKADIDTEFLSHKTGAIYECSKCKTKFIWKDKPKESPEEFNRNKIMNQLKNKIKKYN